MAMPARSEAVCLFVDGKVHSDWDSYDVDSDLLTPADAWRVTLSPKHPGDVPPSVKPGAPVKICVGDETVMSGRIDRRRDGIRKAGVRTEISGRDGAAVLLDCSAPIFVAQMIGLAEVVAKIVRKLGVGVIDIRGQSRRNGKVNVNPGETAWQTLENVAEANGLWPWFEPDGTLVIGGPDYDAPPVASLFLRLDGIGNNVIDLERELSIHGRYSELTVLGQAHGTSVEEGRSAIHDKATDDGVTWYRPKIIVDHEAQSVAIAQSRARKLLADGRLNAFTLSATVTGHRITAPGKPSVGLLWKPGQRVHVVSEPHGIDETFFLMARKFTGGRDQEPRTHLTLKEDRTWVLDAHPHKRKYRCRKDSATAQVWDLSKGTE